MALSKEEKNRRVFDKAIRLFQNTQAALRNERLQCLQDRRFANVAGAQWEDLRLQFENRPMMEVNRVALAVRRGISEMRNNPVSVSFIAKDGKDATKFADVCTALFRADEQDSSADDAYATADGDALTGGFGAYRLRAVLADPYNPDPAKREYQRIIVEPIPDADSTVFFDLNAKQMDKSDATHCWVLSSLSKSQYEADYGELPEILKSAEGRVSRIDSVTNGDGVNMLASMQKTVFQSQFDWLTPDVVYIAEYYCVEEVKEKAEKWTNPAGEIAYHDSEELDELDPDTGAKFRDFLTLTGWTMVEELKRPVRKVHKYLMDGARILRDDGYIAGEYIPIIPVYGIRTFVDNVERTMGIVRTAKDPQRMLNVQASRLLEIASLSTYKKPIFTPEQVAGHEERWATDNINQYPYMLNNALIGPDGTQIVSVGPASYTSPPEVPQALSALIQMTSTMIDDLMGAPTQNDQIMANVSGKAVDLTQQAKSLNLFQIMDNRAKSRKHSGRVYLSIAKEIYTDSGRIMKGLGTDGNVTTIELNKPTMADGVQTQANDFESADLDVAVDVGPTSVSRKAALAREFTGLLQYTQNDPQLAKIIMMMILRNTEGEGLGDFQEWVRSQLVTMGVVKPNEDEQKAMEQAAQNKEPDAQTLALQAMAQQQQADATLKRVQTIKTLADSQKAKADADKVKAETIEILHGMDMAERQQLMEMLSQASNMAPPQGQAQPAPGPSALPQILQNPASGPSGNQ